MSDSQGAMSQGAMSQNAMDLGLDPLLLEILACPCEAHAALEVNSAQQLLVCTVCGRGFPVRDGIPVMLLDEAVAADS